MALTITQHPGAYTPAYNPMIFVVQSPNYGQPNFRYIYQVTCGGETITIKQSARPGGDGIIDIHRIVESYLNYGFAGPTGLFEVHAGAAVIYTIQAGEEYGTTVVEHLNIVNFTGQAFNAAFEMSGEYNELLASLNTGNYYIGTSTKKFLTNAPHTQYIGRSQKAYLYYITNVAHKAGALEVNTYNAAGVNLNSVGILNDLEAPTSAQFFQRVEVGFAALVEEGLPDDPDVAYYTVQLFPTSGSASSELFTFYIDDLCTKYTVYRFHFLNKWGGYDAFNFKLKDTLTTDIKRKTFERINTVHGNGTYEYDEQRHGITTTDLRFTDKIKVESDWITDTQAVWLKELFTSPEVIWENEAGEFIPVTLSVTNYETKKSSQAEKLHNVTVEFQLTEQSRQRA